MGNIIGNSLKLAQAGATDSLRLDTAPDGMQFDGIRLNVSCPVTVTGTPTLVTADLIAFVKRAVGSIVLEEGPRDARRMLYASADGQDLRTVHRWWMENEITNNVVGAQVAGAGTFTCSIFIPFTQPPHIRGTPRKPGTTQVRTMLLRVTEGSSAINGAVARAAGTLVLDVEYVCNAGPDVWAPLLTMQRESSPRRDALGPDGATLLAYVPDTAAASSALTAFNVQIVNGAGAVRVTDVQSVAAITRAFTDEMVDQGAAGITDEHTVVYYVPAGMDVDRAPHGAIRFEEAKSDLSPVNLRFVYFPARDALRAKAEAKASANAKGGTVLLTQPIVDEDADPGSAATQPARVFDQNDARFTTKAGLVASSGSDVVNVTLPAPIIAAVKGAKGAGDGQGRRAAKVASLMVPGAAGTDGGRRGDVADAISRIVG